MSVYLNKCTGKKILRYFINRNKIYRWIRIRIFYLSILPLDPPASQWAKIVEHSTLIIQILENLLIYEQIKYQNFIIGSSIIGTSVGVAVGPRSSGRLATTLVDRYFHHYFLFCSVLFCSVLFSVATFSHRTALRMKKCL